MLKFLTNQEANSIRYDFNDFVITAGNSYIYSVFKLRQELEKD
jgi:hypothetical protein